MFDVFLTGGHGFVGSSVYDALSKNGYSVVAPTRRQLDLSNSEAITEFLSGFDFKIVIHCAGYVGGIAANRDDQFSFLDKNLSIGRNVINAARTAGISRLLNLGSTCVYPAGLKGPLTEDMVSIGNLEPTNEGYAIAKITTMKLCEFLSDKNQNINYKTVFPCNLFGPGENIDQFKSHLIPAIIQKTLSAKNNNEKHIEVWGSGSVRREFMYIGDFSQALLYVVKNFDRAPQRLNIGTQIDHTIIELYRMIANIIGWDGDYTFNKNMPDGIKQKLSDISRLKNMGYRNTPDLIKGLKLTVDHFERFILR